MAIGPTYHSDEELIKRLQIVVKDIPAGSSDLARFEGDKRELHNLTAELATRICDDPDRWGIAGIPPELRDDAAADTLVSLLTTVSTFRGHQPIAEWFTAQVAARSQQLRSMHEQPAAPRPAAAAGKRGKGAQQQEPSVPSVFSNGLWQGFEETSPKDAFALRLRYMLNRSPDEMAEMLEAPSPRAVTMRLNRARDRFRMFCEQNGSDLRATEALLQELGEGRKR